MTSWLIVISFLASATDGFSVPTTTTTPNSSRPRHRTFHSHGSLPRIHRPTTTTTTTTTTTQLHVLLDVPDGFFTFTFPVLGILLSLSKSFGRRRMEERAWEQRLEEAREDRLRDDPTLTEIELRGKEAALEWSAYGSGGTKPPEESSTSREEDREYKYGSKRVRVLEREEEEYVDDEDDDKARRKTPDNYRMTDEEIELFEAEYGVSYDPYYDDPYTEDELPDDSPFNVDRRYGDRIYESGEIFYKDKDSGLFYRQGAKPRSLTFWK